MNSRLPILALCLVIVSPGLAAEKKHKSRSNGNTLPPVSPMLALSPAPESVIQAKDASGLITTQLGGRDLDFFASLMETGQLQILLGDLVKTKAESEQLKSVGGALVSSQAEENRQIVRLAELNGITLSPEAPGAQRKASSELEKLSGADFDRACVGKIVEVNQLTVRAYKEGAESSTPQIKSFAEQMLPVSEKRLRIAEEIVVKGAKPSSPPATPAPASATPAPVLRTPAPRNSTMQLRPATSPSATPSENQADILKRRMLLRAPAPENATPPPPLSLQTGETATPLLSTPVPISTPLTLDPSAPPPPKSPASPSGK